MKQLDADVLKMFVTANNFSESAELLFEQEDSFFKGYNTVAIVDCAFACEVYLKLLIGNKAGNKKTHKLNDLFKKLPISLQNFINNELLKNVYSLKDSFGRDLLDNIADAFVNWRYNYEFSTLHIETSFLIEFCRVLRECCCKELFNSTWENCKGKI